MGGHVPRHKERTNVSAALDGRGSVVKVRILLFHMLGVLNLDVMVMYANDCKSCNG